MKAIAKYPPIKVIGFFLIVSLLVSCDGVQQEMVDYNGNIYKVKQYGKSIWMIENLRATHDHSGNEVTYYYPNNDSTNTKDFGLLYDYQVACKICPDGWRLPTNEDWEELFDLENQNLASNFKDSKHWKGEKNSNISQFSIRPAGYGNNGEHPNNFNDKVILWSKDMEDEHFVWSYILEQGSNSIRIASQHPTYAFTVRCIKESGQ